MKKEEEEAREAKLKPQTPPDKSLMALINILHILKENQKNIFVQNFEKFLKKCFVAKISKITPETVPDQNEPSDQVGPRKKSIFI